MEKIAEQPKWRISVFNLNCPYRYEVKDVVYCMDHPMVSNPSDPVKVCKEERCPIIINKSIPIQKLFGHFQEDKHRSTLNIYLFDGVGTVYFMDGNRNQHLFIPIGESIATDQFGATRLNCKHMKIRYPEWKKRYCRGVEKYICKDYDAKLCPSQCISNHKASSCLDGGGTVTFEKMEDK